MEDEIQELKALRPQAPPEDVNAFVYYLYHTMLKSSQMMNSKRAQTQRVMTMSRIIY